MARQLFRLIAAALLLLASLVAAQADRRVAFVVGNGAYRHAESLPNPMLDARAMRDALQQLGFEVVYGEDLDRKQMGQTIARFADLARDADVALAYFAGHGATFGDIPYLVPVDAEFKSLAAMPYELVPLEGLLAELRQSRGVRLAIIDACRDNGAERELKRVAQRGGGINRGLSRVQSPEGLIIAFATQYGMTAADGPAGTNSPFTAAMVKLLPTPGLDVKSLFLDVGREVLQVTNGAQRPAIEISLYDHYALVARSEPGPASPPPVTPAPVSPAPVAASSPPPVVASRPIIAKDPPALAPSSPDGPLVPAQKSLGSIWNHNGSMVRLEASADVRRFVYLRVREGMRQAGVSPGTLLFEGRRTGNVYSGTAYVFNRNCGPAAYRVSGFVLNDTRIVISGRAPRVSQKTCEVLSYKDDELVFEYMENG